MCKWKDAKSVHLAQRSNKSDRNIGIDHHYRSDLCETKKGRDDARCPKWVFTQRNRIGRRQDYYEDKNTIGQYIPWIFQECMINISGMKDVRRLSTNGCSNHCTE